MDLNYTRYKSLNAIERTIKTYRNAVYWFAHTLKFLGNDRPTYQLPALSKVEWAGKKHGRYFPVNWHCLFAHHLGYSKIPAFLVDLYFAAIQTFGMHFYKHFSNEIIDLRRACNDSNTILQDSVQIHYNALCGHERVHYAFFGQILQYFHDFIDLFGNWNILGQLLLTSGVKVTVFYSANHVDMYVLPNLFP